MTTSDIDADLIGKAVSDENNREIGKVMSFLIDSSAQVKDVLVQDRNESFVKYPVEWLRINEDGILLISNLDKRVELLSEKFPVMRKKREVLAGLYQEKVIPADIHENLAKEFDRALDGMKSEAQELLDETERKRRFQEDHIKTLQIARTFLEIEHGIGNVKDELYQQSLSSILNEIKNASQKKIGLLKTREKITGILKGEPQATPKPKPEAEPLAEPKTTLKQEQKAEPRLVVREEKSGLPVESREEKHAITVHMTNE